MTRRKLKILSIILCVIPFVCIILMPIFGYGTKLFYKMIELILIDFLILILIIVAYTKVNTKTSYRKVRTVRAYELKNDNREDIEEFLKTFLKNNNFVLKEYLYGEEIYCLEEPDSSKECITYKFNDKYLILEYFVVGVKQNNIYVELSVEPNSMTMLYKNRNKLVKIVDELENNLNKLI